MQIALHDPPQAGIRRQCLGRVLRVAPEQERFAQAMAEVHRGEHRRRMREIAAGRSARAAVRLARQRVHGAACEGDDRERLELAPGQDPARMQGRLRRPGARPAHGDGHGPNRGDVEQDRGGGVRRFMKRDDPQLVLGPIVRRCDRQAEVGRDHAPPSEPGRGASLLHPGRDVGAGPSDREMGDPRQVLPGEVLAQVRPKDPHERGGVGPRDADRGMQPARPDKGRIQVLRVVGRPDDDQLRGRLRGVGVEFREDVVAHGGPPVAPPIVHRGPVGDAVALVEEQQRRRERRGTLQRLLGCAEHAAEIPVAAGEPLPHAGGDERDPRRLGDGPRQGGLPEARFRIP